MLGVHAKDEILKWYLTASSVTRPTTWFMSLHTADPGTTGTGEVTGGDDADYVRQSITFADPDGSHVSLSTLLASWTVDSGSSGYTVTAVGIWDDVAAGNFWEGKILAVPEDLVALQTFDLAVGRVRASFTDV